MKVKELIRQLKKCDPDAIVCVDGIAINFVHQLPRYYDGWYEYMDDGKLVMTDKGTKVVIKLMSVLDFLGDDPDGAVVINSQWELKSEQISKSVEKIRQQAREILNDERDEFNETNI